VRMTEAIQSESFALLDIWDLCTAYYVPANKASKKTLAETLESLGYETGVLHRSDLPEFSAAYREATEEERGKATLATKPLPASFEAKLDRRLRIVASGSAGGRVRTAMRLVARAGILSGLWVTQRDDYPITVKTGHSVSELILSPTEVSYTGIVRPDVLLILTEDGLTKARGHLAKMDSTGRVFVIPDFADVETAGQVTVIDPSKSPKKIGAGELALYACTRAMVELGLLSGDSIKEAAGLQRAAFAKESLAVIEAALAS